jgi:hypothetical protein
MTSPAARAPKVSALVLLDRLEQSGVIAAEVKDRAKALYEKAGVHPLSGLLRLNAVAESVLYKNAARLLGVDLLELQADTDIVDLSRSVTQGAQTLGLTWAWLSEKGLLSFEENGRWTIAFREEVSQDVSAMLDRKLTQLRQTPQVVRARAPTTESTRLTECDRRRRRHPYFARAG